MNGGMKSAYLTSIIMGKYYEEIYGKGAITFQHLTLKMKL